MLRRHSRAVFASHYVFPGGVLEACDTESHHRCSGVTAAQADSMIGIECGLDFYSAAIREAFEESAILLARTSDRSWAFCDDSADSADKYRTMLNAGQMSWSDFLEQNDLWPAYDSLHYFAYWVTPRRRRKRFSTRFFLAVLPEGQCAMHDERELTDSCWMTVDAILASHQRDEMKLMYPTISALRAIGQYDNIEGIVNWAKRRGDSGEAQLLPAFVEVAGKEMVVMPGDPHYPSEFDT